MLGNYAWASEPLSWTPVPPPLLIGASLPLINGGIWLLITPSYTSEVLNVNKLPDITATGNLLERPDILSLLGN